MDGRIESIREIARSAVPVLLLLAYALSVARCDGPRSPRSEASRAPWLAFDRAIAEAPRPWGIERPDC